MNWLNRLIRRRREDTASPDALAERRACGLAVLTILEATSLETTSLEATSPEATSLESAGATVLASKRDDRACARSRTLPINLIAVDAAEYADLC